MTNGIGFERLLIIAGYNVSSSVRPCSWCFASIAQIGDEGMGALRSLQKPESFVLVEYSDKQFQGIENLRSNLKGPYETFCVLL